VVVPVDRRKAALCRWYEFFHDRRKASRTQIRSSRCLGGLTGKAMGFDVFISLPSSDRFHDAERKISVTSEPRFYPVFVRDWQQVRRSPKRSRPNSDSDDFDGGGRSEGQRDGNLLRFPINCSRISSLCEGASGLVFPSPRRETIKYDENPSQKYGGKGRRSLNCTIPIGRILERNEGCPFCSEVAKGFAVRVRQFRIPNECVLECTISEIQAEYPDVIFIAEAFTVQDDERWREGG